MAVQQETGARAAAQTDTSALRPRPQTLSLVPRSSPGSDPVPGPHRDAGLHPSHPDGCGPASSRFPWPTTQMRHRPDHLPGRRGMRGGGLIVRRPAPSLLTGGERRSSASTLCATTALASGPETTAAFTSLSHPTTSAVPTRSPRPAAPGTGSPRSRTAAARGRRGCARPVRSLAAELRQVFWPLPTPMGSLA